MEFLVSDNGDHCLAGDVDLTVLDELDSVEDHSLHGSLALSVSLERHALDEAVQEVLNDDKLGIGLSGLGKGVVVSLSAGDVSGLEHVVWELEISHGWLVHDGLESHILVLGSGECLYSQLDI